MNDQSVPETPGASSSSCVISIVMDKSTNLDICFFDRGEHTCTTCNCHSQPDPFATAKKLWKRLSPLAIILYIVSFFFGEHNSYNSVYTINSNLLISLSLPPVWL